MMTRPNYAARLASIPRVLAVAALLFSIATPAAAQNERNTQTDARWQAWLGCWTPANTLVRVIGRTQASVVCVLPTSSASAVDLLTVSGGKVVDRTHIDTDGQRHAMAKDGCTGWQSAKWSSSARRVYLKSEVNCKGANATHLSAMYAMVGSGEWVDVQGMRIDKNVGVHAVRYRESDLSAELPVEITGKLQERNLSKLAAMLAVSETPSIDDVAEASHELDAAVVATWLVEVDKVAMQKPEPLNAKQLVQLADNGVPSSVIDVMLGLVYPKVLAVNPVANGEVSLQNSANPYDRVGSLARYSSPNGIIGFDRFGNPIYAAEVSMVGMCSPYIGYGPYDAGWSTMYSQLGCSRYGYSGLGGSFYGGYPGYGGYYGGYYPGYYTGVFGGIPVVTPIGSGTGAPVTHGRVVNGHGYSQGSSGESGSASPRSNSQSPSSSSSGSNGSAASSPPASSPPPARTAQPRKP